MFAYLWKNAPCYPITNQWCYLIAVADGFTLLLGGLQCYQLLMLSRSYTDIMRPLKAEHKRKAKQKREEKRWQKMRQKKEMPKKERQRQEPQYLPAISKPEAAHIPQSYDMEMASMDSWHHQHQQPVTQHERNYNWVPETCQSRTASRQPRSGKKRSKTRETSRRKERNGQSEQGNVPRSSARHRPRPDLTHPSALDKQYHQSASKTRHRRQIPRDMTGTTIVATTTSYPEHSENIGHPGSQHRNQPSRPGGSSAASIQRTATGASSNWRWRHHHEPHVEDVSPLSSVVDLRRLSPYSIPRRSESLPRRSVSPLSVRPDRDQRVPEITVTPCGSNRSSIISQSSGYYYEAHQSDSESTTSNTTFHTAPCADVHRPAPAHNNFCVPATPELEGDDDRGPPSNTKGQYAQEWLNRKQGKKRAESF